MSLSHTTLVLVFSKLHQTLSRTAQQSIPPPARHSISSFIWRQTLFSRSLLFSHLLCLNTCFVAFPLFTAATLFSPASSSARTQTGACKTDAESSKALRCRWIRLRMLHFCRLCLFLQLQTSEVAAICRELTHDAAGTAFPTRAC